MFHDKVKVFQATALVILAMTCMSAVRCAPADAEVPKDNGKPVVKDVMTYLAEDLKPERNLIISPFNIDIALALIHLGASGETKKQISKYFDFPADENLFHLSYESSSGILNTIQTSPGAEIKIANTLFLEKGLKLKDSYLQAAKTYYNSEPQQVEFSKGGSEATETVNNWISENTKKRIPKLFKSDLSPATQLLIASALFFNASWNEPFKKSETHKEKFNTGVKDVEVPMMKNLKTIRYYVNNDLQYEAISIPYEKEHFFMTVILPFKNQSAQALAKSLSWRDYQRVASALSQNYSYVEYKIPRFKFSWSESLNQYIIKLGMDKIFGGAEFENLIESGNVQVSDISHAAEIEVHEDGTVASAVTTTAFTRSGHVYFGPDPIKFYADRPFIFCIHHKKVEGSLLFTGVVQNPAEQA